MIESLSPFWVHFCLIGGDVLATIAVGWGIIWEGAKYQPWQHHVANRLIIWGIVAETLCSVCLFAFDESISQSQQGKIIALDTELKRVIGSNRELEKALDRQGKKIASADFRLDDISDQADDLTGSLDSLQGDLDNLQSSQFALGRKQSEADKRIGGVDMETKRAANSLANTEKEQQEFEEASSPRQMEQISVARTIMPYHDTLAFIMVSPTFGDTEFAAYLWTAIHFGHWNVASLPDDGGSLPMGIEIQYLDGGGGEGAAKTLCKALVSLTRSWTRSF